MGWPRKVRIPGHSIGSSQPRSCVRLGQLPQVAALLVQEPSGDQGGRVSVQVLVCVAHGAFRHAGRLSNVTRSDLLGGLRQQADGVDDGRGDRHRRLAIPRPRTNIHRPVPMQPQLISCLAPDQVPGLRTVTAELQEVETCRSGYERLAGARTQRHWGCAAPRPRPSPQRPSCPAA